MSTDLTPTEVARLDGIMSQLASEEPGSMVQEALSSFFGTSVPADGAVEGLANAVAERIGLRQSGGVMQSGAYILTKTAILESAQLLGLGAGMTKLDLSGFQMAQVKQMVEEINKKLDVVLAAPLKLALDCYGRAGVKLEHGDIHGMIKELEKVQSHAQQGYQYAEGQGVQNESLKNGVIAKQLVIMSEVIISSYDGTKITPFFLLDENKKRSLATLINHDVGAMLAFANSQSLPMLTFNKTEKLQKRQDILDVLLKSTYPLMSEGLGLTTSLAPVTKSPYQLRLKPTMVPEGESDAAKVTIGQLYGTPLVVEVWRKDEDKVYVRMMDGLMSEQKLPKDKDTDLTIPVPCPNLLLKSGYRKMSEEKGLTSSETEVVLPFPLRLLPHLLPEGSEYGAMLPIGRSGGQEREVTVYREGSEVVVKDKVWGRYKVAFTDQQEEVEVTLGKFHLTPP